GGSVDGSGLAGAARAAVGDVASRGGLACGAAGGGVLGVLSAFSGGPRGAGRLAAVGPSGWQVGAVAALEIGIASAVTAGIANWLRMGGRLRRGAAPAGPGGAPEPGRPAGRPPGPPPP